MNSGDILFLNYYALPSLIFKEISDYSYFSATIICNNSFITFDKEKTKIVKMDNLLKSPTIRDIHIRKIKEPIDEEKLFKCFESLEGIPQENYKNTIKLINGVSPIRTGKLCSEILQEILSQFFPLDLPNVPFPDHFASGLDDYYHPLEKLSQNNLDSSSYQFIHRSNNRHIDNNLLFKLYPNCVDY